MSIYLLKHAESFANKNGVHPNRDTQLSENGILQTFNLTKGLNKISFDAVVSSPMERAKQTSEIINQELNVQLIYSNLFEEIQNLQKLFVLSIVIKTQK